MTRRSSEHDTLTSFFDTQPDPVFLRVSTCFYVFLWPVPRRQMQCDESTWCAAHNSVGPVGGWAQRHQFFTAWLMVTTSDLCRLQLGFSVGLQREALLMTIINHNYQLIIRQLWTTDCQPVTKREDWKGVRHNVSLQSTCPGSFHTVRGTCLPPWSSKKQSKRTHILTWFDCCNIPSKHSNNKISVSFLFKLISPKNIARQNASKHLRRNIFPIIPV